MAEASEQKSNIHELLEIFRLIRHDDISQLNKHFNEKLDKFSCSQEKIKYLHKSQKQILTEILFGFIPNDHKVGETLLIKGFLCLLKNRKLVNGINTDLSKMDEKLKVSTLLN